jgi:integrase
MAYTEVPAFMARLREREAIAALALEFVILTAARSGEALNCGWKEIDIENAVWVIPGHRMKAGKDHRVPLCTRALQILSTLRATAASQDGYVFPGEKPGRPPSINVMPKLLARMGVKATVHGFRSSFRDWASETTGFAHQTVEQALAHTIQNKAEAAYRRGDQLGKRRELMAAWQSFCESGGVVVPFKQVNA